MPLKIYTLEEDGKYKDTVVLESDKEASAKAHKSIYHLPEEPYTRVKPPKEREGLDRYFDGVHWNCRKQEELDASEQVEEPKEEKGESDGE